MNSVSYIVTCLVCGKEKQYGKKLLFFRFPHDIDRCRSWVKAIGMRELLFMPIDKLREQVVCGDHFDPICINEKLKRLHKVAIPSKSLYPPLSDVLLNDFPKNINNPDTAPTMQNRDFDYAPAKRRYKSAPRILNEDPVIDFERPLMNCLETLEHNERHAVRKPAGILNSISVPLMTYSSSLEKDTVFAADNPGSKFNLPFVPFIEPFIEVNRKVYRGRNDRTPKNKRTSSNVVDANLDYPNTSDVFREPDNETMDHQNIETKKYINVKAMAHSKHTNACDGSLVANSGKVVDANSYDPNFSDVSLKPKNDETIDHQNKVTQKYINVKDMAHTKHTQVADTTFKKPLIGTVKPNLKSSVYKIPKISSHRNCNVSFGLQTLITGSPRKANKDSNVSSVLNISKPNTGSRYKGIKQYTNNKLAIHSIQNKIPHVPVTRTEKQTTDANPKTPDVTTTFKENKDTNKSTKITKLVPTRIFRTSNGNILQVYKPEDTEHANPSLVLNTELIPSREATQKDASPINTQTCDSPASINPNASRESPDTTSNDLLFVPYTQYAATVTPESRDAHTGEGTLDYGLPLMNCIGTVFQGNINSTVKTEEIDSSDETAIDIPLMQCFKTLENSSIR